jgi:hypothetical protein
MGTQIQLASSSIPSGFKYNVSTWTGYPPAPGPSVGQVLIINYDNGEGGSDFGGININVTNADGYSMADFLDNLNGQPITIRTASGAYCIMLVQSAQYNVGGYWVIGASSYVGVDPNTLSGTACYFNFETSVPFRPASAGYTMAGNLNGTTITIGTFYIGIGSSTANATENTRSVPVAVTQGNIVNAYVKTAGVMTGSMQLAIMINGVQIGTPYTIPAGGAAGTYYFLTTASIAPNSPVSIRIIQSTATSSGVLGFGWTIK